MRDGMPGRGTTLSPESFAARFQQHKKLFWAIAAGITANRHAAEDIVQESAATALTKLADFNPESSFSAWMSQIVRFTALNHARTTTRRNTHATADLDKGAHPEIVVRPNPITPRGELAPDQPAFDDHVAAALDGLEPPARACLLLRTVVGLSYKEIASAMDLPEGTAMSHVHRARKRMRDTLRGNREEVSRP